MRRLAAAVLLLVVAGCDGGTPPEPPEGFFVARVVDAADAPVAGVAVDLLLGGPDAARRPAVEGRTEGIFRTGSGFPQPAREALTIPLFVESPAAEVEVDGRVYIGTADGTELIPVFDGGLTEGTYAFRADLGALDPGPYVLWTESGDDTDGDAFFVTAGTPGELPVVLPLGTTDADGFVAVAGPEAFPFVTGGAGTVNVLDETGAFLGTGAYGATQRIRLRGPGGAERVVGVTLEGARTVVTLRLE